MCIIKQYFVQKIKYCTGNNNGFRILHLPERKLQNTIAEVNQLIEEKIIQCLWKGIRS